jgi:hypothetical protein
MGELALIVGVGWLLLRELLGDEGELPPGTQAPAGPPGAPVTELDEMGKPKGIVATFVYAPGEDPGCKAYGREQMNVQWVILKVVQRSGATLDRKMPRDASLINPRRAELGAEPVDIVYRQLDLNQTPREWVTNLAYWYAHPRGPVKIPGPTGGCADAWRRIFLQVEGEMAKRSL